MPAKFIVSEKRCPRCKQTKPVAEWYKSKERYDGLSNYCRICMKARRVIYMSKPSAQKARHAYERSYYQNNHERCVQKRREYKQSERGRANAKRRYWEQHEKHLEKNRAYRNSLKGQAARKAYNKRVYADPERRRIMRDKRFQKKFGITVEQYDRQFAAQGGVCAICLRPPNKILLHVDHDHQTGAFRGLLCFPCNVVLGAWNDSPEAADRAGTYLRKHQQLRLVV